MIRLARERAGMSVTALAHRFPRLGAWEEGAALPTLKQLEAFARAVWVPIGYLFLPRPPVEDVPIPDFRTGRRRSEKPSPNLLDTIYLCQARQGWYADYARTAGESGKDFVGSLRMSEPVEEAAASIRDALGFDLEAQRSCSTWTDALRQFIARADGVGILVMCNGVVHNNTHRKLDPDEFRGFAMADALAPLIFINGADTRAAQLFTLAHELGHIWLGRTALTDANPGAIGADVDAAAQTERGVVLDGGAGAIGGGDIETWCNRVAAELLVPMAALRQELRSREPVQDATARLARRFKVSTLVILRRMLDAMALSRTRFKREYDAELARIAARPKSTGGDFYLTQPVRASRRFVVALVESTLEGRTLYRDAFRMLGISKVETFRELGRAVHAIA